MSWLVVLLNYWLCRALGSTPKFFTGSGSLPVLDVTLGRFSPLHWLKKLSYCLVLLLNDYSFSIRESSATESILEAVPLTKKA